jgi:nucleotide sugar dehydrogenase
MVILKLTGIGVTEGIIKETLENSSGFKVGKDFGLAYAPFHTSQTRDLQTAAKARRIVASSDRNSLTASSAVLESIVRGQLCKTANVKLAETAALFEVQEQDVSIALRNELAFLCEKLSVDYPEVNEFLKRSNETSLPFLALSNGDVQDEPYLLLSDAENMNVRLRIPATAREVNERLARYIANLVKDALRSCGKTMRRARVSLLGLSQTPNVKSHPKKITKEVAQVLTARGVRITLYDPYFSANDLADVQLQCRKNFTEAVEGADCILVLTGHDQFKKMNLSRLKVLMKMPSAIVDLEGILEPDKVEREGFIYRGLGRGVWTK